MTLAVAAGAHGVGGEVRLKTFTDDLSPYRSFNDGALTIVQVRRGPHGAVARFAEVTGRDAAEAMRGTELTVPRSALPPLQEGEYYHADLVGLPCDTEDGTAVGTVAAVENFGAGDILDIEKPDGRRFMVPIAAATIGARVTVDAAFVE